MEVKLSMASKKREKKVKTKDDCDDSSIDDAFRSLAVKISLLSGNVWVFIVSSFLVIFWLILGFFFNFSDNWQLIINLTLSIITFLIVFFIQNSQTRDTKAIQLKLDELIRSHELARNTIIDLDSLSEEGIKQLEKHYKKISGECSDPLPTKVSKTPKK